MAARTSGGRRRLPDASRTKVRVRVTALWKRTAGAPAAGTGCGLGSEPSPAPSSLSAARTGGGGIGTRFQGRRDRSQAGRHAVLHACPHSSIQKQRCGMLRAAIWLLLPPGTDLPTPRRPRRAPPPRRGGAGPAGGPSTPQSTGTGPGEEGGRDGRAGQLARECMRRYMSAWGQAPPASTPQAGRPRCLLAKTC